MVSDQFLLVLSRAQFGATASFHYLFVPLSVGLALMVAWMDTVGVVKRQAALTLGARFWSRFLVVAWMAGFITGYPLRQQLAERWGVYSEQVAPVLHAVMSLEGVLAPAMVLLIVGLALAARSLPVAWRLACRWMLLAVMLVQCYGIVSVNAWMQHPVGTQWSERGAVLVSVSDIFLSPTAVDKVSHTLSAAMLTGALFTLSVSAWYLLRRRHQEVAAASMRLALPLAAVALAVTVVTGHGSARGVMAHQPMKFAAMEAHWRRDAGPSPLVILAWPDMSGQYNAGAVEIPHLLSWLATHGPASPPGMEDLVAQARGQIALSVEARHDPSLSGWRQLYDATALKTSGWNALTPEQRLDKTALASRPHVPTVFFAFRVMVGSALLLGLLLWLAMRRQSVLAQGKDRLMLRVLCFAVPLPWVATLAGWLVAEAGRQPWVVTGQLTTAAAATLPAAAQVMGDVLAFSVGYSVLALVMAWVVCSLIRRGPQADELPWGEWRRQWRLRRSGGFMATRAD